MSELSGLLFRIRFILAGWSSLVARQAHNLKVVGSNPAPATKLKYLSNNVDYLVNYQFKKEDKLPSLSIASSDLPCHTFHCNDSTSLECGSSNWLIN